MKTFKLRKAVSFPKKKEEVQDPVPVEHHLDDPPPERVQEERGQEGQAHAGQRLRHVCSRVTSRPLHMFCVTTTTHCFLHLYKS